MHDEIYISLYHRCIALRNGNLSFGNVEMTFDLFLDIVAIQTESTTLVQFYSCTIHVLL